MVLEKFFFKLVNHKKNCLWRPWEFCTD